MFTTGRGLIVMSNSRVWVVFILAISTITLLACGRTANKPDASTKYIETMKLIIETTAFYESQNSALLTKESTSTITPVVTGTNTPAPTETLASGIASTLTTTKTVPRIKFNTGAPKATNTPEATQTELPTSTPNEVKSPAATITNPPIPTQTDLPAPTEEKPAVPTNTPKSTPTESPPNPDPGTIVWQAKHETGDISEWQQHGDFVRQGNSSWYSMITPLSHSGSYSVSLTIDTEGQSSTGSYSAYLFYWDQLPKDGYYYSAWYYIPGDTHPQHWWNIWQWKSTYNGNSDYSVPVHVLDMTERWDGELMLAMYYRPDSESEKIYYDQKIKTAPRDQWFHIEAYYEKAVDNTGKVIIWQDGVEIFNLSNVKTTMEDNTVYWSVNNYTNEIEPSLVSIMIDDAAISTQRLGPNFTLP